MAEMQILQEQYICHPVPTITMGVWLLGFGFLRRSTSCIPAIVCRLLTSVQSSRSLLTMTRCFTTILVVTATPNPPLFAAGSNIAIRGFSPLLLIV